MFKLNNFKLIALSDISHSTSVNLKENIQKKLALLNHLSKTNKF